MFGAGRYVNIPSQSVPGDHCTYVPNRYYYDKSKIEWGKIVVKRSTVAGNHGGSTGGIESGYPGSAGGTLQVIQ